MGGVLEDAQDPTEQQKQERLTSDFPHRPALSLYMSRTHLTLSSPRGTLVIHVISMKRLAHRDA